MSKQSHDRTISKLIRQTYESLESHLDWTHKKTYEKNCPGCRGEGNKFQKQCVKEYAQMIVDLSDLL